MPRRPGCAGRDPQAGGDASPRRGRTAVKVPTIICYFGAEKIPRSGRPWQTPATQWHERTRRRARYRAGMILLHLPPPQLDRCRIVPGPGCGVPTHPIPAHLSGTLWNRYGAPWACAPFENVTTGRYQQNIGAKGQDFELDAAQEPAACGLGGRPRIRLALCRHGEFMSSGNAMLDGSCGAAGTWPIVHITYYFAHAGEFSGFDSNWTSVGAERLSGRAPVVGQRRQPHVHRSVKPRQRDIHRTFGVRRLLRQRRHVGGMIRPTTPRRPTAIITTRVPDGTITTRTAACGSAAYAFHMLVHELGHGLGLAHPHDTGGGFDHLAGRDWPLQLLRHQQPQPGHLHRHVVQCRLGPGAGSDRQRVDHVRIRRRPDGVRHRGDPISLRRQHVVSHGRRHLHAARRQCARHLLDLHLGCRRHRSDRLWRHP